MLSAHNLLAQRLIIGTYTNNNASKGIYVFDFNAATGEGEEINAAQAPQFRLSRLRWLGLSRHVLDHF